MDLICYVQQGWAPLIRPAPATRDWMDHTPQSFAYRCLPLNIANAHGWEILNPVGFRACWNGDGSVEGVTVEADPGAAPERVPVSLFGQGVLTFHIEGIFRTPDGWNLWVGPAPNRAKDGISPLTGVIETDWSPFTFTMNWRFTRPHHWVRFEAMEPFGFLFPVQRSGLEAFEPRFESLDLDPDTKCRFEAWSKERDAFHAKMRDHFPESGSDAWQKHYYRGMDVSGQVLARDHQTKLRLRDFDRGATPQVPAAPTNDEVAAAKHEAMPENGGGEEPNGEAVLLRRSLAKREWLLEALEKQRDLAPELVRLERRAGLGTQEFLERYYALNRPVILTGEMLDWPALANWTPDYLKQKVAGRPIEFQGDRTSSRWFERYKDAHRREAPFDAFLDLILKEGAGNDAYITAYNSARNETSLATLHEDMGTLDKFLDPQAENPFGMLWIGPAGTFTSLHHDLTNNLIAQLVGRKQVKLLPASEVGKLYNDAHVFSEVPDLDDAGIDLTRHPRLSEVRIYDITLEPGEIIFMPFGWWHQVKALDFSVTATFTNFRWPNQAYESYPE